MNRKKTNGNWNTGRGFQKLFNSWHDNLKWIPYKKINKKPNFSLKYIFIRLNEFE